MFSYSPITISNQILSLISFFFINGEQRFREDLAELGSEPGSLTSEAMVWQPHCLSSDIRCVIGTQRCYWLSSYRCCTRIMTIKQTNTFGNWELLPFLSPVWLVLPTPLGKGRAETPAGSVPSLNLGKKELRRGCKWPKVLKLNVVKTALALRHSAPSSYCIFINLGEMLVDVLERGNIFAAKQLGAHVTEQNLSRAYLNPLGVRKRIVRSSLPRIQ